jgi:hypothetical protein
MASTSKLTGTWMGGGNVARGTEVVIALYANLPRGNITVAEKDHRPKQRAAFAILKEWVRQHIKEKPEMHRFADNMTTIEGRGFLFEFLSVDWGNENDPFYILLQRTLKEMAEVFNCQAHNNCGTDYALEYAYVMNGGIRYETTRLGAYAYAVGVKVQLDVASQYMVMEDEDGNWIPF